jgi:hypothetical protein
MTMIFVIFWAERRFSYTVSINQRRIDACGHTPRQRSLYDAGSRKCSN